MHLYRVPNHILFNSSANTLKSIILTLFTVSTTQNFSLAFLFVVAARICQLNVLLQVVFAILAKF